VHGGGSPEEYDGKFVRYRGIRVKELDAAARDWNADHGESLWPARQRLQADSPRSGDRFEI